MVHVFREMGAEPHRPPASISQITDLFQLAQVGKCWESPEYAPGPQRMSIKKKRGDRSRCYRVKELSGLAFSTSPRLRAKKNRHPLRDGCLYSEVSVTKLIFCKGTKSSQSCNICRVFDLEYSSSHDFHESILRFNRKIFRDLHKNKRDKFLRTCLLVR